MSPRPPSTVLRRLALALVALAASSCAIGANLLVNTTADELDSLVPNDRCSLREAVVSVNEQRNVGGCIASGTYGSNDVIGFVGSQTQVYRLTREHTPFANRQDYGNLFLRRSVKVIGMGARRTIVDADGLSIQGAGGVFEVDDGATVTIQDLTVRNGAASLGGGIAVFGTATLLRVSVLDNTAFLSGGNGGNGGGVYQGGDGTLWIEHSTIAGNTAWSLGGGLLAYGSKTHVFASTITDNEALIGGGGYLLSTDLTTLSAVTVTGNRLIGTAQSSYGGGLVVPRPEEVRVEGSAIAQNRTYPGGGFDDCFGPFVSDGYNLVGVARSGCTGFGHATDLRGSVAQPLDASLGPLGNNGGATDTHLPLAGSPLIDAGAPGFLDACADVDQRGQDRPIDGNGDGIVRCDIGAVEAPSAPQANLSVDIWDDGAAVPAGGDMVYGVRVTNHGPASVPSGITYVVDIPTGAAAPSPPPAQCTVQGATLRCDGGGLAAGESRETTVRLVAPSAPGGVIVRVTVSSPVPDPDAADDTDEEPTLVRAAGTSDVMPFVQHPATVAFGEEIAYRIAAYNAGPDTATLTVLSAQIPPNTTFVSADGCARVNQLVSCVIGDLAAGQEHATTLRVTAPDSATQVQLALTAKAENDDDPTNDSATAGTAVVAPEVHEAELFVALNGPGQVEAGSAAELALIIHNNGPDDATGVVATVELPPGLTNVAAGGPCSVTTTEVVCLLGPVAAFGSTRSLPIAFVAPQETGTATFTAAIEGDQDDPFAGNDSATSQVEVVPQADPGEEPGEEPGEAQGFSRLEFAVSAVPGAPPRLDAVVERPVLTATIGHVRTQAGAVAPAELSSVAVRATSTGLAASGRALAYSVYLDVDGDGAIGEGDTRLGGGVAEVGGSAVSTPLDPAPGISVGDEAGLIVAAAVASTQPARVLLAGTLPLALFSLLAFASPLPGRRRRAGALVRAVLAASLLVAACGAPVPPQPPTEVEVELGLESAVAVYQGSTAQVAVVGLPSQGAAVELVTD